MHLSHESLMAGSNSAHSSSQQAQTPGWDVSGMLISAFAQSNCTIAVNIYVARALHRMHRTEMKNSGMLAFQMRIKLHTTAHTENLPVRRVFSSIVIL